MQKAFEAIQRLLGKPVLWAGIVLGLALALTLNILTGNKFDPGMAYANFLQNWVQLLALAVSSVTLVAMSTRDDDLHAKVDALHDKHDALHEKIDASSSNNV